MAEMAESSGGGHKKGGKVRGKKQSTRIDMTPMVDLGFLLVTFFMLATTFSKPKTMEITMPVKDKEEEQKDPPIKVNWKEAIVLILHEKNRIYWYQDPEDLQMKVTNFSTEKGVRKLLREKKKEVAALGPGTDGKPKKLTVIIKATDQAKYKNMVDIFDEMNINDITKYALVDIDPKEKEIISKTVEPAN